MIFTLGMTTYKAVIILHKQSMNKIGLLVIQITRCMQHIHDIVLSNNLELFTKYMVTHAVSQAQSGSEMFQALSQFVCTLCIVTRPAYKPYME